jgi:KDO2-lipid IV(A) lauroyltransferase
MFFLVALSRLPLRILYLLSDVLYFFCCYVIRYRNDVIRRNLRNSFPEKSEREITQIQKQFYRSLCDFGMETLKFRTISFEELKRRVVFKNIELVKACAERNQPVFYLLSHQFNWEWVLGTSALAMPLPIDFVYQEQSNKFFNQFSLDSRTRFGYPVKREQVARESIKRKNVLRAVGTLVDQFPGNPSDKKYWTTFLHQETAFFAGIDQLVSMTQYPVFLLAVHKVKRGYYQVDVIPVSEPPYEKGSTRVIDSFAKESEKIISKYPSEWLWSHNRWKGKRSDYTS